jgi:hypothetical protein
MADRMIFHKTGLTSGGAGCLDSISGANRGDTNPLQADDAAFVMVSSTLYAYLFDAASTAVDTGTTVIKPDDIAAIGPGRWLLQGSAIDITTYLGETSVLAYRGDRGKTAYDHSQVAHAPSDANNYVHPNHSGDVTSAADGAQTIAANAVTLAKLATQAADTVLANVTDGAAVPTAYVVDEQEVLGRITGGRLTGLSAANIRTLINVADGANNYSHPNHSGDVTSSGDGATTIAAKAVDVAMLADGTDGELITWGADGVATTVAVGTATHVLTSNGAGAAPTFQAAAGGSGHIIEEETTPLTARASLRFTGAGVTATDDAGNNVTIVTIPGGAGGGDFLVCQVFT